MSFAALLRVTRSASQNQEEYYQPAALKLSSSMEENEMGRIPKGPKDAKEAQSRSATR